MLAYPHVIRTGNELLMFYNGNDYGKTGIALAKLNLNFLKKKLNILNNGKILWDSNAKKD